MQSAGAGVQNLLTKGSLNHLTHQLKLTPEQHFEQVGQNLQEAQKRGITSNVYLEDWSNGMRNSKSYVFDYLDFLVNQPIKRILLPDTLGILTPEETAVFLKEILERYPTTHFDFHGHNDYDLGVANAVLDGTDAVMLSAESAVGQYPVETIKAMAEICLAAERADPSELDADFAGAMFKRIDQAIAMGALFTAHHMGAKAIVAMTDSGSTPLWMSRHLIKVPIYALTSKVATQRRMTLFRNVRPLFIDTSADRDTALAQSEADLKARGIVSTGDIYAITCGEPMGSPGGTNMLKICRVR